MTHIYTAEFYDYISAGSRASARVVIPNMRLAMRIDSVLDVGAGVGAWAAQWLEEGVSEVIAVDGHYAEGGALLVSPDNFVAHDLSAPLRLNQRFDLVQSLEVAEHIAPDQADCFVESLTAHGDVILFSAAVPGQGGEHHINEQPPEYWRRKFGARGYSAFDWLRPQLSDAKDVQPWYRYNSIIFANGDGERRLSEEVLATRVPQDRRLRSTGSLGWRLRRAAVTLMPRWVVTRLAVANAARQVRAMRRYAA